MTQLTLKDAATAEALKEQGLDAVSVSADRFLKVMRAAAIRISDESGFVSSDNLRVLADAMGLVPHHPNAWGAIFRGLCWQMVGRQKSALPGNHAREIRVWLYVREGHP